MAVSKLNDAESEAAETQTWIEIALRCRYLTPEQASYLDKRCEELRSPIGGDDFPSRAMDN